MKKAKVFSIITRKERSEKLRNNAEAISYPSICSNISSKRLDLINDFLYIGVQNNIAENILMPICNIINAYEYDNSAYFIKFNEKQFNDAWKLL